MSPASYLAAPPRVAGSSIAKKAGCYSRRTVLFWLSLAFLVVAVVGSIAFAVVRGLETWRAMKRLGGGVTGELDRIATATAEIELHLQAAAASGQSLDTSLRRLSASRARLNVLTTALADARTAFGRLTDVYPRK